jgi:hypothetical protein
VANDMVWFCSSYREWYFCFCWLEENWLMLARYHTQKCLNSVQFDVLIV